MNRKLLLVIALLYLPGGFAQQSPESSPIGYASIEEAFDALENDQSATMTLYEGWTIFNQKNNGVYVIWSFTSADHPTHPTVVRREIVKRGDEISIKMDALCHSSRLDCDQLMAEFEKINARIKQSQSGVSGQ